MIWKTLKDGDTRIRRKFLLWPVTLNDIHRWWEYAEFEEIYFKSGWDKKGHYHASTGWSPVRWTDLEEENPVKKSDVSIRDVAEELTKKYQRKTRK